MDSSCSSSSGSHTLLALAQQLRTYIPPPIPGADNDDDDETEDQTVSDRPERFIPKRAAVLVCIFEGGSGEFRVILTKRSSKLSTHPGEVVFPGGKVDESDANDAETATREAQEEIGLDPSLVDVVTTLEPFLSKHLLIVIPVIGILSDRKALCPSPNAAEVEAVFDAPLEMFLKGESRRAEEKEWMGDEYQINFFDYEMDGEVALPGGKADESDANDVETATREAQEEIGLDPSLVNVVTTLEPFLSKHLLKVIPVIGVLSDRKAFCPSPNAAEVEAVFDAPLEMFLKDENRRSEEREWIGDKYLIHFFDYEMDGKTYLIWGLTAGILIKAASVVYQRSPVFLEQNPKFKMPRVLNRDTTM